MFGNDDGTSSYECFCELHGEDRNPNRNGPNRVTIMSDGDVDHCNDMFLNMAATNVYEVFLDAMIDDETDELEVESWSPMAVSKLCSVLLDVY